MADQASLRRDLNLPAEQNLTDRIDAKIVKAEREAATAKANLDHGTAAVARSKQVYDGLHDLTSGIENLAPMIRDEVNALERVWRDAEIARKKLDDQLIDATREVASAQLARKQMQQIGLYTPTK
jgi:hypothetical protein